MPTVLNRRISGVPPRAVYVGRPSKWGNPFTIGMVHQGRTLTRGDAVSAFEDWFLYSNEGHELQKDLEELRGKSLVCWCSPLLCHASVLLEHANK